MTDDFLSPDTMTEQYVHWFRNSAPYINAHRGKTFVLMFGGEAVNHDNFRNIIINDWLCFIVFYLTDGWFCLLFTGKCSSRDYWRCLWLFYFRLHY